MPELGDLNGGLKIIGLGCFEMTVVILVAGSQILCRRIYCLPAFPESNNLPLPWA